MRALVVLGSGTHLSGADIGLRKEGRRGGGGSG